MKIIDQMLQNYKIDNVEDKKHAMKEIMQEITLAALAKTDFFKHAAFYGGSALRIFYNLDRFSDDLDFSLLRVNDGFSFDKYIPTINSVVESMGLKFKVVEKAKTSDSHILSAFLKGNTKEQFLIFYPESPDELLLHKDEKTTIKFEVDIFPPDYAKTELKFRLLPFPYQVRIYDKSSLFAGKIHAVIAREWKNRVKGRDLYDYIFYLSSQTKVNLKHLEARLKQTNTIDKDEILTIENLKSLLIKKFNDINYDKAKEDVLPFLENPDILDIWSSNFFISITEQLEYI